MGKLVPETTVTMVEPHEANSQIDRKDVDAMILLLKGQLIDYTHISAWQCF